MNKMREYERGREDGLDLAYRIVQHGGIEALKKRIEIPWSNRNQNIFGGKGSWQGRRSD